MHRKVVGNGVLFVADGGDVVVGRLRVRDYGVWLREVEGEQGAGGDDGRQGLNGTGFLNSQQSFRGLWLEVVSVLDFVCFILAQEVLLGRPEVSARAIAREFSESKLVLAEHFAEGLGSCFVNVVVYFES